MASPCLRSPTRHRSRQPRQVLSRRRRDPCRVALGTSRYTSRGCEIATGPDTAASRLERVLTAYAEIKRAPRSTSPTSQPPKISSRRPATLAAALDQTRRTAFREADADITKTEIRSTIPEFGAHNDLTLPLSLVHCRSLLGSWERCSRSSRCGRGYHAHRVDPCPTARHDVKKRGAAHRVLRRRLGRLPPLPDNAESSCLGQRPPAVPTQHFPIR